MIAFMCGPSGVGKTAISKVMEKNYDCLVINLDMMCYVNYVRDTGVINMDIVGLYNKVGAQEFCRPGLNDLKRLELNSDDFLSLIDVGSGLLYSEDLFNFILLHPRVFLSCDNKEIALRYAERHGSYPLEKDMHLKGAEDFTNKFQPYFENIVDVSGKTESAAAYEVAKILGITGNELEI